MFGPFWTQVRNLYFRWHSSILIFIAQKIDAYSISKNRPQRSTFTTQRASANPVVSVVRRSITEVTKQRLAIKDGATKQQIMDPSEIPETLDHRDELSACSPEAVSQGLKHVAISNSHGKHRLKHDLWQSLDPDYPYDNAWDRYWTNPRFPNDELSPNNFHQRIHLHQ